MLRIYLLCIIGFAIGGSGVIMFLSNAWADNINCLPGKDCSGTARNDVIKAAGGDNVLVLGEGGDDKIYGSIGTDYIGGGIGNDFMDGGPGNDYLRDYSGYNTYNGGDGNDQINSWWSSDTINGGPGVDIINAEKGNDRIQGGYGPDVIDAGDGNDVIYHSSQSQRNTPDGDVDHIYCGGGFDVVWYGIDDGDMIFDCESRRGH